MALLALGAALLASAGFLVGFASLACEIAAVALGLLAWRELRGLSNDDGGSEFAWVAIALGGLGVLGWIVTLSRGGSLLR
jgi:hypothetical protein